MTSRAIHMHRSIFTAISDSTTIADNDVVYFNQSFADFYTPITIGTTTSDINHIIYDSDTGKFQIKVASYTSNNFLINWSICLNSSLGNLMPVFAIVVYNSDNSIWGTFPSNGEHHTNTIYGSVLIQFPTPTTSDEIVTYTLSLVNQTGASCFYYTKSYELASMLITCIDNS